MNPAEIKDIAVTPEQVAHTAMLFESMGVKKNDGVRFDANETSMFTRSLEYLKAKVYEVLYPAYKARSFVPPSPESAPRGANTITYRVFDMFGMAKLIANYSQDLPRVDVTAAEYTQKVYSIGDSYGFSVQDVASAAMSGIPLDSMRAKMARRAIEAKIDDYIAVGDSALGVKGFTNNTNVTLAVFPNAGLFATLSSAQITENLNHIANLIKTGSKEIFACTDILLDSVSHAVANSMPVGGDNQMTVLRSFMLNHPEIKSVESWTKLSTAGAGGIPRCVAYQKDPEVCCTNIPLEFEQLPPQARGLEFITNCHARIGGVEMHQPLGVVYADVIA